MLYALVVVYNKFCDNSATLKKICEYNDKIKIIVFDNSTKDYDNQKWCKEKDITYYTENKNLGLSKAYNFVIRTLKKNSEDHIIILDDDTNLTDEYFNEVFEVIKNKQYEVFLPIVISDKMIISPCNMKLGCKPARIKSRDDISVKNISAINSGMIIRLDVFDKILYDENMFLDCVDHDFMNNVRKNGFKVYVLKSSIYQNYSLNMKINTESAAFRFNIQKKDVKVYYKKNKHLIIYYLYIFWIALKLSAKYKSLTFFKGLYKNQNSV